MRYAVAVTVVVDANNPAHARAIVENEIDGGLTGELEYRILDEAIPLEGGSAA